jgi:GNAT superfamily N-acetyltransferase
MTTENAEKVLIQKATEVPETALHAFYETMWPSRAPFLKRHWRWLYRVGAYASMQGPWVAVLEGKVIGHAGQIPVTLRLDGKENDAIWFPDLGILPDYQGLGLGKRLTKVWMDACPLHMAFPNDQAERLFKKMGWSFSKDAVSLRVMLKPEAHPRFAKRPWVRAGAAIAGLMLRNYFRGRSLFGAKLEEEIPNGKKLEPFSSQEIPVLHVRRTPEFLKWRILDNPNAREFKILKLGGRENISALVRIFEREGYRRLHVMSLCGKSGRWNDFFAALMKWSLRQGIHHVWMVTSDPQIIPAAKSWFPFYNSCLQAFHADDKQKLAFLDSPSRLWECMDFEFDLLYC